MAFSLGEYQDIFLEETDEQIQELNDSLLKLEQNPENEDTINSIFRVAHSLKSSAAFVGLNDLSELAHKMENLLQGVRDKTLTITPSIIDLLFKCFDRINSVIGAVSEGRQPDTDLAGVIEEIKTADEIGKAEYSKTGGVAPGKEEPPVAEKGLPKTTFDTNEKRALKKGLDNGLLCYEITIYLEPDIPMKWAKAQLIVNTVKNIGQVLKTIPDEDNLTDEGIDDVFRIVLMTDDDLKVVISACDIDLVTRIDVAKIDIVRKNDKYVLVFGKKETVSESSTSVEEYLSHSHETGDAESYVEKIDEPEPSPIKQEHKTVAPEPKQKSAVEVHKEPEKKEGSVKSSAPVLRTVKVSVDKLDDLLNNVGELVIANSGFFKLFEELKKFNPDKSLINEFRNRMEQMARIAKDLQGGIMKTRMVPIGEVFGRFHRLIRDLSKDVGKKVQLVTKGEDTELDKKVIDVIGEPLMHMIRNSVDHGIEPFEERIRNDKPEVATVTLSAYQGGNQIYVEVIDDGRGLNVEAIKKKAIDKGLVTFEDLANMDDTDVYNFIFQPGFSTAEKITDVSGRGVGMNVVKEVVQEMGGNIMIESEVGVGTRFIMAFPLTLAIIPAIMVKVSNETYAIPLTDVIETINIDVNDITTIEGHEVINLRGEILSLVRLSQFVGVKSYFDNESEIPVIVVGYSNRKIGLLVNKIEGKLEIVIKSLETNFMNVEGLAGASILGDGSIALILDISSMITRVINEQDKILRDEKKSMHSRMMQKKIVEQDKYVIKEEEKEAPQTKAELFVSNEKPQTIEQKPAPVQKKPEIVIEKKPQPMTKSISVQPEVKTAKENGSVKTNGSAPRTETTVRPSIEVKEAKATPVVNIPSLQAAPVGGVEPPAKRLDRIIESVETEVSEKKKESADVPSQDYSKETEAKVKEALKNFKNELKQNIVESVETARPSEHMMMSLQISDREVEKLHLLANVGITNAANSLSMIIGKRIDLAIPEVKMMPVDKVPSTIGMSSDVYIGVYMGLSGDFKGSVLFAVPETSAFKLIDDLYGLENGGTKELDEDGKSALKEITNIIGSSVVNSFAEKTEFSILPTVPVLVYDYIQSIINSIIVDQHIPDESILIMETQFYYANDEIVGHLLVLPESESIKQVLVNLRENE